jgi:hypothetical protein
VSNAGSREEIAQGVKRTGIVADFRKRLSDFGVKPREAKGFMQEFEDHLELRAVDRRHGARFFESVGHARLPPKANSAIVRARSGLTPKRLARYFS